MVRAEEALAAMERLPVEPIGTILTAGPPLILAPHPDDESLGCGGLIAASVLAGMPPFVLVLTDGTGSHPNSRAYPAAKLRRLRQAEAVAAIKELGLDAGRIAFLGLRDTESPIAGPAFDATVSAVAALAIRIGAGSILAPWQHDPHCDHESAHLIAIAAARETNLPHLAYPVWGLTLPPDTPLPGLPTGRRIEITPHLTQKRRAIAAHRSQLGEVIVDDPAGFELPRAFLALFDQPFEILLDVPAT